MSAPVGRNTRVATSSGLAGGGSGPGSPPASTGKLPASPWERSLFGGFSPVARNQPRSEAERGAFVIQVVGGRTTRTGCGSWGRSASRASGSTGLLAAARGATSGRSTRRGWTRRGSRGGVQTVCTAVEGPARSILSAASRDSGRRRLVRYGPRDLPLVAKKGWRPRWQWQEGDARAVRDWWSMALKRVGTGGASPTLCGLF